MSTACIVCVALAVLLLAVYGPSTIRLYRAVSRDRREDQRLSERGLSPGAEQHYGATLDAIRDLPEYEPGPVRWS